MLGNNHRRTTVRVLFSFLVAVILTWGLVGCGEDRIEVPQIPNTEVAFPTQKTEQLSEVAPPTVIQQLSKSLEAYQPQVAIVTPMADQVLQENTIKVEFQVQDLPIFKDPALGLGPHLHVILDNYLEQEVYELDQPLVFEDLSPGTHTLRVFASRPWHESFKNEGAYAQTTFHLFTKTTDNNPDPALPLLTYNRPQGSYGAEPIMLDFYLTNAPLHLVAAEDPDDEIVDWRIRVTVNGQSFVLARWQPFYLKGFKSGKNWVHLEFLDEEGNPVKNVFNDTVQLINYEPKGKDTLSQLVSGELELGVARRIIEPNYQVIPQPTPAPVVAPPPIQLPEQIEEFEEPSPEPIIVPEEEKETSAVLEQPEETSIVPEEKEETPAVPEQLEKTSIVPEEEEETSVVPEQLEKTSEVEQSVIPSEPSALLEESEPALEPEKSKFGGFFRRFLQLVKGENQSATPAVPEELDETPVQQERVIPSEAPASVEELTLPEPDVTSEAEAPLPEPVVIPEELEEIPVLKEPVISSETPASVEELAPTEPTVTSEEEVPLSETVSEELEEPPVAEELVVPSEPPASVEKITPPEPE